MPLMGWEAFCECHNRPFLVQAQLAEGAPEGWLDSLPRFIRSMGLKGNFSLCRGNEGVRAAFELEADAKQVVRALGARDLGPGDEWAGHWTLLLDWAEAEKVTKQASAVRYSPSPQVRPKRRLWPRFHLLGFT
jgi:hypothetical protein